MAYVQPRYVLCPNPARPASVLLGGFGDLRVFAASIAGEEGPAPAGRTRAALGLQAALLLDGRWEAHLPHVSGARPNAGHAEGMSYAKCLGEVLPNSTQISCRTGQGRMFAENTSWSWGRLVSFKNGELRHDFAQCILGASTFRWRKHPGPPVRLHMRLRVHLPVTDQTSILPLELCRVDRPLLGASFCSQPLYGYGALQDSLPWVVEDWLAYHLGHLGFEHAEIYDIDGSLAEVLEPWARSNAWHGTTLTYHREWPRSLSAALEGLSQTHPYCTETWAYAHCLTTHRALSRWVALLHAPDEYLVIRKNPDRGALLEVLEYLEAGLDGEGVVPFLQVNGISFARGGPGAERVVDSERGAVLASSQLRAPGPYHHMPLLDPVTCLCAGPHMCYAEVGAHSRFSGVTKEVAPGMLLVHHYVEMLPRHRGRCGTLSKPCQVPDASVSWIAQLLRSL